VCSYLSGARCRLFAYGPAEATAIPKPHDLLADLNPGWFFLLVPAYPGCPGKEVVIVYASSNLCCVGPGHL